MSRKTVWFVIVVAALRGVPKQLFPPIAAGRRRL